MPGLSPIRIEAMTCALGHEESIEAYIGHLVAIYREIYRVLREDGVAWCVIGDSFSGSGKGQLADGTHAAKYGEKQATNVGTLSGGLPKDNEGLAQGNLMMVPHRLALALQADGWIIRNDVVWHKVAPMPESIAGHRWERHRIKVCELRGNATKPNPDRGDEGHYNLGGNPYAEWQDCPGCSKCEAAGGYILKRGSWRHTRAHEFIFMLCKDMQYFADQEKVREGLNESSLARINQPTFDNQSGGEKDYGPDSNRSVRKTLENFAKSQTGRNPRSVLSPSPEPFLGKHFAVFPTSLITDLIKAACPDKCCLKCGRGWAPTVKRGLTAHDGETKSSYPEGSTAKRLALLRQAARERGTEYQNANQVLGYRPTCECGCDGLQPGDLEIISTPMGKRIAEDPSLETGRAGYNRPRGQEGIRPITRYEQRMYAAQLKKSPHRAEMEKEAGGAFAHYIRTDKSGARPAPQWLLEKWIGQGWVDEVKVPKGKELESVPGTCLDLFSGSGTTGLVCERLGLNSILIDISKEYAEMARNRIIGDAPLLNHVLIIE